MRSIRHAKWELTEGKRAGACGKGGSCRGTDCSRGEETSGQLRSYAEVDSGPVDVLAARLL